MRPGAQGGGLRTIARKEHVLAPGMLRQFFKDSTVYAAGNIISRGISLLLLPFYTRVFSPADYGIIDILTVFATLVNVTIALEISQGVARYFPDATTQAEKIAYASTALWFTVGMYTLFVVVAYIATPVLTPWLLQGQGHEALLRVVILSLWGNGIFYLAQNQLRWQLQSTLYAIANLTFTLATISMTILFVLGLHLGILGFFYGQLVGSMLGAILALYFARHSYRFVFDRAKQTDMLRFSIPLVPSSIAVFIAAYMDRIAIQKLMSMADVGLFGVGYRLASVISLVMVGFQGALIPLVLTHYREPGTPAELARIFRYFLALALLIFLGLSVFSREILALFTTPDCYAASDVLPLLVPAVLLSGMYIFAPGLTITKNTKAFGIVNLMAALLNVILNFALIPYLGITGAALATLTSAFGAFAALMIKSQKVYLVPHNWKRIIGSLLPIVVLVGGNEVISRSTQLVSAPFVLWPLKSVIVLCGVALVSCILIGQQEVRAVVRRLKRTCRLGMPGRVGKLPS